MKKIFKRIFLVLAIILIVLVSFVLSSWNKKFDVSMPDIKASTDSAIIARGKYLVYGPSHCATCHIPMEKYNDVEKGEQIPLSGGWELDIPPGIFRAPNITPDNETGIGKYTDGQLARALRFSVKHDNTTLFPFMPYQEMTDEDLTAIISFLRSQKPVKNKVKRSELKFLGKALSAFGLLEPEKPKNITQKTIYRDTTKDYGKYLANVIANCYGCHTERNVKTGEFIGKPFAGGFVMKEKSKGLTFITPNLTPDNETGVIAQWNKKAFINRFRQGPIYEFSPMPWGAFSRMDENDLKALYEYFASLPAVKNKIEKTIYKNDEELPD
ncbi:MAG: c-type cytochrome [Bacteroidetes bacterium]|nr:c-type cytochrome [Bacteroidota bacterium]